MSFVMMPIMTSQLLFLARFFDCDDGAIGGLRRVAAASRASFANLSARSRAVLASFAAASAANSRFTRALRSSHTSAHVACAVRRTASRLREGLNPGMEIPLRKLICSPRFRNAQGPTSLHSFCLRFHL